MAVTELARGTSTTLNTTVTATYAGASVTSGHLIVVAAENDNDSDTATCADDAGVGNSYNRDDNVQPSGSTSVCIFSCKLAGTIDNGTIWTVTWPVATSRKGIIVYHVDDLDTTTWFLENGRANATSQAPSATLDAAVSENDTLTLMGGVCISDGALDWTPDGTDGDVLDFASNRSLMTSWRYRTSAGTHSEGGTFTDTAAIWGAVIGCYKKAEGAVFKQQAILI